MFYLLERVSAMTLEPRVYVTRDSDATIRAIANTADHPYSPDSGELCFSSDGKTFVPVLFTCDESGPGYYIGSVTQPALRINDHVINFANGEIVYKGHAYALDPTATIGKVIAKPVMHIASIVETYAGLYVAAQNLLTGRSHDFLDGKPLTGVSTRRVRNLDGLVEDSQYVGHRLIVRGNPLYMALQTVTFDGQPATRLDPEDYVVTFVDDLSAVTVNKK